MKYLTSIIGIALIIFGILALVYKGYTYNTEEKVAQLGSVQVTAEKQNTLTFPPFLGGLSIAAGVVLVFLSTRK